jgi:GT2 family glycosyltransferase
MRDAERREGAPRMGAPRVAAVVLNWCGERDTAACLESLRAQTHPALDVLLVDNGSPDGSGDRLHAAHPDVPYLQTGENLGYTGGNNRGFAWALERGAAYVLVVNNDTVLEAQCVARLVEAAEAARGAGVRVGMVAPKILYHDAPDRVWFAGGRFSRLRALGVHRHELERDDPARDRGVERIDFVTGCVFLVPAEVLRAVGGFREEYFAYVEDVELSLRMTRAGLALLYQPAARVLHRVEVARPRLTPFQLRQGTRNRRRLVRQHYGALDRVGFACWFYPTRLVQLARYGARRDWARARALWEGVVTPLSAPPARPAPR